MSSILSDVKIFCDIESDDDSFDIPITIHINGLFATLFENAAGPSDGFVVSNVKTTWDEFTSNKILQALVKQYICIATKLEFDPSTSSTLTQALSAKADELLWRIREYAEGRFTQ